MTRSDPQNHKTYTTMPGIKFGGLTTENLELLAKIAGRYAPPMIKITGGQRLSFLGLPPDKLDALKKELDIPDKPRHSRNQLHNIQACPGSQWCKYGTGDSLAMGEALDNLVLDKPLPHKVKVGISGCRMCCCESWVRDVGLVAEKKGWRFIFGGNAGGRPRIGDVVAEHLSTDEAVALIEKCLNFYIEQASAKTRSARFMERFGIEALKEGILG